MGDRKGHYVRPVGRLTAPSSLLSMCWDHLPFEGVENNSTVVQANTTIHVAAQKRGRGGWGAVQVDKADGPSELLALMYDYGSKSYANYVLCPSPHALFALARVWEHFDAHRVAWVPKRPTAKRALDNNNILVRRIFRSPRCEVIDWVQFGRRWVFVAHCNYLPFDEEDIAKQVGFQWETDRLGEPRSVQGTRSARERARLWLAAGRCLTDWWRSHATAPWGLTTGQLATSMMRSMIERKALCTHNHTDAHALERRACHGGRATAHYFGRVGDPQAHDHPEAPAPRPRHDRAVSGPLSLVDYRSMYPSLLRDCQFPVKLIAYHYEMSPKDLIDLAKSRSLIADVVVESTRPDYPCRTGHRTAYPVGRFHATLTGVEVSAIAGHGKIVQVGQCAVYATGSPFAPAAAYLIRLRDRHRADGDRVYETFVKLLANSIGGKLAQRKGRWVERKNKFPQQRWGDWFELQGDGKKPRRYRAVSGLVWEYVEDPGGAGPHTAAFAYLSAYGRLAIARLIRCAGERQVVSCDTDGVWVLPDGIDNIKRSGYRFGDSAGQLRIVKRVPAALFLGPRHYWTPGRWVLSGFSGFTVSPDGLTVTDERSLVPTACGPDGPPDRVYTTIRKSTLRCEIAGGSAGPDGWWVPKRMNYQITTSGSRG